MHTPQRLPFIFLLPGILIFLPPVHAGDTDYRAPETVAGTTTVTAAEVKALHDAGTVIIDVRSPRLYARRHIPGANHLDMKDVFNRESLAAVAGKDQPIVIYSSSVSCGRAYRASVLAASWGYGKVHYFRGGMVDWKDADFPMESGQR